jgi:hypothetical protein
VGLAPGNFLAPRTVSTREAIRANQDLTQTDHFAGQTTREKSLSWPDLGALCYNPAANRLVVAHFSDWPKNVDDLGVKTEVLEHGSNHHEMMLSSALPLRTTILVGYMASLGSILTSSAVPQPYFLFLASQTGSEHESRESHVPRKT